MSRPVDGAVAAVGRMVVAVVVGGVDDAGGEPARRGRTRRPVRLEWLLSGDFR